MDQGCACGLGVSHRTCPVAAAQQKPDGREACHSLCRVPLLRGKLALATDLARSMHRAAVESSLPVTRARMAPNRSQADCHCCVKYGQAAGVHHACDETPPHARGGRGRASSSCELVRHWSFLAAHDIRRANSVCGRASPTVSSFDSGLQRVRTRLAVAAWSVHGVELTTSLSSEACRIFQPT